MINDIGKLLGTRSVSTDTAGYLDLLTWANSFGHLRRAGVEGTGTYGAGLARVLHDHKIEVLEVNRPDRAMRRSKGKSELNVECDKARKSFPSPILLTDLRSADGDTCRTNAVQIRAYDRQRTDEELRQAQAICSPAVLLVVYLSNPHQPAFIWLNRLIATEPFYFMSCERTRHDRRRC